ncbi:hypothetical protein [Cognatiyoonia sp.]|uniref:hypothetical protein n=1 Tax=Cognatiyoonia sp. TaxID=2211652 RepID=UPI003F69B1F2
MKIASIMALGLVVGLAACNGDRYTGKVKNAEDLAACYAKALKAEVAYRTGLMLRVPDLDRQLAEDPKKLDEWASAVADMQIAVIGLWKANLMTIAQMVEEAEKPIKWRDGAAFSVSCDVAYITQEKIVWPSL